MTQPDPRYTMSVSRRTVDQLGIKLYDRVAAVLAELVANAYDGDAETVTITAPLGEYLSERDGTDKGHSITIEDDGHGMTPQEVNDFYLPVGAARREDGRRGGQSRHKNRDVMGRKGIGKLAPFGICTSIEILTAGGSRTSAGYEVAHLRLDFGGILKEEIKPYYPEVLDLDGTFRPHRGTKIIMTAFLHKLMPNADSIHRQLAARFGIRQADWRILIRDSRSATEFAIGDLDIPLLADTRRDLTDEFVPIEDKQFPVKGWVAISRDPYKDDAMAGIRVFARKKIVAQTRDFDIPAGFHGEHTLRSYLVGEIHADWLDDDEADDMVRSDRQDILWSTERGAAFQKWGQALIRRIGNDTTGPRQKRAWDVFVEKTQFQDIVSARFPGQREVQQGVLNVAKAIAQNTSRDELGKEEVLQSISDLAISVGPHQMLVSKLQDVSSKVQLPFQALVQLFTEAQLAETHSLGQVARERVLAITRLQEKVDGAASEAELQELIESAPWLINPQWTILTKNQTLARLREAFERWYEETYKEPVVTTAMDSSGKRPDFVMINFNSRIEIVEIKRRSHRIDRNDFDRLHRYHEAMLRFLESNPSFSSEFPNGYRITLVCDGIALDGVVLTAYQGLENSGIIKQMSWNDFLGNTQRFHEEFLAVVRIGTAAR